MYNILSAEFNLIKEKVNKPTLATISPPASANALILLYNTADPATYEEAPSIAVTTHVRIDFLYFQKMTL